MEEIENVKTINTTKKRNAIYIELNSILDSEEFRNSEVLRAFLSFIVTETIEGRAHQLKSIVIANAVFKRGAEDHGAENAVRTAAVRLRTALATYQARQSTPNTVVISLPKGGYVPSFGFHDPSAITSLGKGSPRHRRATRLAVAFVAAMILIGVAGLALIIVRSDSVDNIEPVIVVHGVGVEGEAVEGLSRRIGHRLAPYLSAIGLGEIVLAGEDEAVDSTGGFQLELFSTIDLDGSALHLRLVDARGVLQWVGQEDLTNLEARTLDGVISVVAFKILGENGAVPLLLERKSGQLYREVGCVTRAQLLLRVQRDAEFEHIQSCLEQHLETNSHDAAAWAALGATRVVRTRYYTATASEGYDTLLENARFATERAVELAPAAYLTRVASMHLALSEGNVADFLSLQQTLRTEYPGDIYQHLRIASRLTRLGYPGEALEIYNEALTLGINLSDRWQELAFAHYLMGNRHEAHDYISRSYSTQQYVLLLRAAILGWMGRFEEARPVIRDILTQNPDIAAEFYPWHLSLGWGRDVVDAVAEGLAQAGLEVEIPPSV